MNSKLVDYFNHGLKKTSFVLIFSAISGAIFPLAFAPFEWWPIAFLSIGSLLYLILYQQAVSLFKLGFVWGVGCHIIGSSWVYVSIHEFGHAPWYGAGLLTLLFVAYLALYTGLFAFVTGKLLKKYSQVWLLIIAPLVWLCCELIRSYLFNGFSWLSTGYSQLNSPFGEFASYLGVYGVSWLVILTSTAILLLIINRKPRIATITLSVVIFANLFLAFDVIEEKTQFDDARLKVGLVQPNVPQEIKWKQIYFSKIMSKLMTETDKLWQQDLIIWPEAAIPAYEQNVEPIIEKLDELARQSNTLLILGIPDYNDELDKSFVALKSYGEKRLTYHKQLLVPFGEYVPFGDWLRGLIQFFNMPMSNFSPAVTPQQPLMLKNYSVIPAICYEVAYPNIMSQLIDKVENHDKPMFIVTISNDAWFGDSLGPYQHMQMAQMRARETGLPLLRVANDGITGIVNNQGRLIEQLPRYQQAGIKTSFLLQNRKTYYRQYGMSSVLFLISLSILLLVLDQGLRRFNKKR